MLRRILYAALEHLPGYRFGWDGSIWSRFLQPSNRGRGKHPIIIDGWRKIFPMPNRDGYPSVALKTIWGRRKYRVHRLILEAFVGKRPKGKVCRHLDGNRDNNHATNLCWGTPLQNSRDTIKHGRIKRGIDKRGAKLDATRFRMIFTLRWSGRSFEEIGRRLEISASLAGMVFRRSRWKHFPIPARRLQLID